MRDITSPSSDVVVRARGWNKHGQTNYTNRDTVSFVACGFPTGNWAVSCIKIEGRANMPDTTLLFDVSIVGYSEALKTKHRLLPDVVEGGYMATGWRGMNPDEHYGAFYFIETSVEGDKTVYGTTDDPDLVPVGTLGIRSDQFLTNVYTYHEKQWVGVRFDSDDPGSFWVFNPGYFFPVLISEDEDRMMFDPILYDEEDGKLWYGINAWQGSSQGWFSLSQDVLFEIIPDEENPARRKFRPIQGDPKTINWKKPNRPMGGSPKAALKGLVEMNVISPVR
jgi:hypothetical protein